MNELPKDGDLGPAMLDAEWARIAQLLALAEAQRTGQLVDDAFSDTFDEVNDAVEAGRAQGSWHNLAAVVPAVSLEQLTRLDLDILSLALAPVARPVLAPRIHALQPQMGTAWPGVPLAQELLMLDGAADMAVFFAALAPTSALVGSGLLRVEGESPYQILRPGPLPIRALLGRDPELAPPPGATLSAARGDWDDLILPSAARASLRDLTAWIAQTDRVRSAWGGRQTHGPLALFCGASGTGKSFAAGVIAAALSERTGAPWALYTLDLGRIMSKYVGETEANLNALLDSLDGRRAILQIDEADGLLGKRGEVSDARDRYANLEVSHMLSRFERHNGPVILTTNLRSNVDSAFLRRFQLVVDFPAPDGPARAELWNRLLPPGAPRGLDLDLDLVAGAVRISGGAIANAAHYAAILAAERDRSIGLAEVARAVHAELMKDGRQVRKTEIGSLADHLGEAP
ncbi:MAG: ATP-binding protein [Pseudomonadota bacterium]